MIWSKNETSSVITNTGNKIIAITTAAFATKNLQKAWSTFFNLTISQFRIWLNDMNVHHTASKPDNAD